MSFEKDKEKTLTKMASDDRSDKGSVDEPIKKLLDLINKKSNYYSTSSCSGRVIIIKIPRSGSKKDAEFLYRTHKLAEKREVIKILTNIRDCIDESVWFRQEPAIIHVAAKTIDDASKLLRIARTIGFKRCGLFEVKKRFLLELMSTEKIDTILARHGKILVSEEYLKTLVEEANKKLKRTWEKTKKFQQELSRL